MPRFTIETTCRIPVYRQRTYEAETLEQACHLAIEDDDWSEQKENDDLLQRHLRHRHRLRGDARGRAGARPLSDAARSG